MYILQHTTSCNPASSNDLWREVLHSSEGVARRTEPQMTMQFAITVPQEEDSGEESFIRDSRLIETLRLTVGAGDCKSSFGSNAMLRNVSSY